MKIFTLVLGFLVSLAVQAKTDRTYIPYKGNNIFSNTGGIYIQSAKKDILLSDEKIDKAIDELMAQSQQSNVKNDADIKSEVSEVDRSSEMEQVAEPEYESYDKRWMHYYATDMDVSEFFIKKSQNDFKNSKWQYRTKIDEVERIKTTLAFIKSTNSVNMGIGQGGNQHLYITIRNQHDTGFYNDGIRIGYQDALVEVCQYCVMRARFDDNEAKSYMLEYINPHTFIISKKDNPLDDKIYQDVKLKDDDDFFLNLYNSKELVLNFPNWNGNTYTYKFNLRGLNTQKLGKK